VKNSSELLVIELSDQITAFFRALEAERTRDAESVGLTPTEYRAIARVVQAHEMTPKKLAEAMGMSTGAITAITDHLVQRGLLDRQTNAADRRSITLRPTATARTDVEKLFGAYRALVAEAIADSSDRDIQQLVLTLGRLTDRLSQAQKLPALRARFALDRPDHP
jgi:DNA-binding MarR family transcriptional regulator